jgi:hypothetical protein
VQEAAAIVGALPSAITITIALGVGAFCPGASSVTSSTSAQSPECESQPCASSNPPGIRRMYLVLPRRRFRHSIGAPVNTITALTNGSENLIALQTEISRTLVAVERAQMHAE